MRHLIGTSANWRDRRIGADALRPNTCLRRLRIRRANLHQRPDEPTQKPIQIGGFCGFPFLLPSTFTYNPETFKVAVTLTKRNPNVKFDFGEQVVVEYTPDEMLKSFDFIGNEE